ncbi:MAG: hypothetical protein ABI426_05635, partial [Flavobacterium sp.]
REKTCWIISIVTQIVKTGRTNIEIGFKTTYPNSNQLSICKLLSLDCRLQSWNNTTSSSSMEDKELGNMAKKSKLFHRYIHKRL